MSELADTVETISNLVASVFRSPDRYDTLSSGEAVAVAMVLNRPDLVDQEDWTMLGAADRLGPVWLKAALKVQRQMCDEEKALGQALFKTRNAA